MSGSIPTDAPAAILKTCLVLPLTAEVRVATCRAVKVVLDGPENKGI